MTTPNKLQVKPDLSGVDENQKDWSMQDLIDAIHKWLRRNSTETGADQPEKSEKHWYTQQGENLKSFWGGGAKNKITAVKTVLLPVAHA